MSLELVVGFTRSLLSEQLHEAFPDEDIALRLDERVIYVSDMLLRAHRMMDSGVYVYRRFQTPTDRRYYGDDVQLRVGDGNPVTADVRHDTLNGIFVFAADQGSSVYIDGSSYDPYGTAADLLEQFSSMQSELCHRSG